MSEEFPILSLEMQVLHAVADLARAWDTETIAVLDAEKSTDAEIHGGGSVARCARDERVAKEATASRIAIELEIRRLAHLLVRDAR